MSNSQSLDASPLSDPTAQLDAVQAQLDALINALSDRLYEVNELGNVYNFKGSTTDGTIVVPERLVGHNLAEYLPPQLFETCMRAFQLAVAHGRHRGTCLPLDTERGRRWVELSISLKRQASNTGPRRLLVLVHDITHRKEAEDALVKSEARYRAIFENTGTAVVIYDNDGLITLANDEFTKLTGYRREQVEDKMYWMQVIDPTFLNKQLEYHRLRQSESGAAPRRYESRVIGAVGDVHEGILTIELIPGTTERVASFLDLTELKKAERQMFQAEKMASLGQIVAGVTHEINNPNNFIYFNLPILRRYVDALVDELQSREPAVQALELLGMPYPQFVEDLGKLLDNMEHGSKRITDIVEELKHYVRGNEEEKRVERIETVVTRAMTLVGKQVRKMVRRLEEQIAAGLPPVLMDPGKIEQVIVNLLINAAQAADKDDSWVKLSVGLHDKRPNVIHLQVSDNGMGIKSENLHRIFEPFFTSKGRDTGTGLGLSICQRIVEEHGGRITVLSTPGQGACFSVELPISVN